MDVNRMDLSFILNMDRELLSFFNGSDSLFLDNIVLSLTSGLIWVPLYISFLYVVIKNNDTMPQILLIIGCAAMCVLTTYILTDFIVKPYIGRWRPTNDPYIKYTIDVVNQLRETKYGFFSAHAANTFSIALFMSLLFKNKAFTVSIICWSLMNCWTRLYLGVHYPLDILCGLLFGACIGTLAYKTYRYIYVRITIADRKKSPHYTCSGYYIPDINLVLGVLAFMMCYAIIYGLIRI